MFGRHFYNPMTGILAGILSAVRHLPRYQTVVFAKAPRKARKPGLRYPHSSKRQNARIARQMAAGQLNFVA